MSARVDEALSPEDDLYASSLDVARRTGHLILLVRKRMAAFGPDREGEKKVEDYANVLRLLSELGIVEADEILTHSLRDLT